VIHLARADIDAVRPSVGYEADQFFFGYNYLDWQDGWPVVVVA
jgi:arabinan endo-1,5-alpha-L-arabinosidase